MATNREIEFDVCNLRDPGSQTALVLGDYSLKRAAASSAHRKLQLARRLPSSAASSFRARFMLLAFASRALDSGVEDSSVQLYTSVDSELLHFRILTDRWLMMLLLHTISLLLSRLLNNLRLCSPSEGSQARVAGALGARTALS